MESAQHTEGSSPSNNANNRRTPRNNSTQPQRQPRARSQPLKPRRPSARPPPSETTEPRSDPSDREIESDVEEVGRFLSPPPPNNSGSRQPRSRPRPARRPSSTAPRPAPAPSMPSEDEHLVEPVPRRPAIPVRRSAPRRMPRLGEAGASSVQASDTDTTTSSSSSGPPLNRRRPIRTRTEMGLSLRQPIHEHPEAGAIVQPGKEFGPDWDGNRPLPKRTKNPRDILKDGERGFIVDLKLNLEVEVEIKAKLMGDLTLSVL